MEVWNAYALYYLRSSCKFLTAKGMLQQFLLHFFSYAISSELLNCLSTNTLTAVADLEGVWVVHWDQIVSIS